MAEPGRRARQKAVTRALIVRTANRMFLRRGFDAVTVDEIAAECGISSRTIPRYFPTKDEIALAPHRDDLERFKKDLANREADAVSCWREYVVASTADMIRTEKRLRAHWAMLAAAPSLDGGRLAIWQEYEDALTEAVAREADDKEGLTSRVLASLLINSYAALLRHVLTSERHHVRSEVFLNVLDHVANSFHDFRPRPRRARAQASRG